MMSWARMTSNSVVNGKQGFVMQGVEGFKNLYGIGNLVGTSKDSTILGYTVDNVPHIIDNVNDPKVYQKFRPMPGVESIIVNKDASQALAQLAVDPVQAKIDIAPGATAAVTQTAKGTP